MTLKIVDGEKEIIDEAHDKEPQIIKLSASAMKTYEQCPRKYFFTYIEKAPKKEWDHFDLGNLCHKALEVFHKIYMEEGTNKGSLSKLMKHAFTEARTSLGKKLEDKMIEEAYNLLMGYLKNVSKSGMPLVKGVESAFTFKIREDILIRGFIDRLDVIKDGRFHIVDYKTTKNEYYLEPFQLLIYGLWLRQEFGNIDSYKASYVLLRHNSKYKEYEFNAFDLDKTEKQVISYAEKIGTENTWVPVPSKLCNWCDFKEICPAHTAW